jgi:hypothetical protein
MTLKRYPSLKAPSPFQPIFLWLLMLSIFSFGVFVGWDQGLLLPLFEQDATRLSVAVCIILALMTLHSGYRSVWISKELRALEVFRDYPQQQYTGVAQGYFAARFRHHEETPQLALIAETMSDRAHRNHSVGWFCAGLLIKLGLLGTVAGFVMMLGSLDGLDNLDTSDVTKLMSQMTGGMRIAMNTTLVGLSASILLSAQYLLLDRCADHLVTVCIETGESLNGLRVRG